MKILDILNEGSQQNTYGGWKAACKRAHPGCTFRGDKDIGGAVVDGRDVGEWDGEKGTVFAAKPANESVENGNVNAKELARLKDELAHMPKNPSTQEHYDMIDDLKAKIKRLEAGASA